MPVYNFADKTIEKIHRIILTVIIYESNTNRLKYNELISVSLEILTILELLTVLKEKEKNSKYLSDKYLELLGIVQLKGVEPSWT